MSERESAFLTRLAGNIIAIAGRGMSVCTEEYHISRKTVIDKCNWIISIRKKGYITELEAVELMIDLAKN